LRDVEGKIIACVELVREDNREEIRGFKASGSIRAEGAAKSATSKGGIDCYLGMLTVRPTSQGGGLGKYFLEHSEKVARGWGCDRIRMTVIDRRPELIAYYERRGYVRTGVTMPFHFDDLRFGIAKVEIQMVELAKVIAS
jgi:GNAT superfamily N-acetyltransferase